tara:strand:+ start:3433 stop:4722 length:1290 start_codon:yes stop_codon:yes gene_type:complete
MEYDVPPDYLITDTRKSSEFGGKTISNYKKKDVVSRLHDSIVNQKIEESCRWFIELNCSNMNIDIWSELIIVYAKYININNFRILEQLYTKYQYYKRLIKGIDKKNIIHSRNVQEIRNMFVFLITQVALSDKNDLFNKKIIPTVKAVDFQREGLVTNMKCQNLDLIIEIVNENDIKELKIAINEISYNIRVCQNFTKAVFWYQWICKLYTLKKKAGIQLTLNSRNINGIDDKFKTDWIWLLWKILLNEAIKKENKQLISNVKYLYSLYKIDYKTSCISKYHFIIYQVLYIIIKPVNFNRCYISKEYLSVQATMNINKLYQAIDYNVGKEYSNKDSFIEKENYVQKIKQDMYNEENRKRDAMVKKKEKKIKQEEHEEYETTNKLSYLNDLLFIKQSAKPVKTEEKDVVKYFKDDIKDKIKDKIIYKNIVY